MAACEMNIVAIARGIVEVMYIRRTMLAPRSTTATDRGGFALGEVLPRLVSAYETGRLVPFIGVGMSRPNCADWAGLIAGLEREAGIDDRHEPVQKSTTTANPEPAELIQRANRAVRMLRASADGVFRRALETALFPEAHGIPAQMAALAKIRWPLVLTTNYVGAFDEALGADGLAVVGRSAEDCQRVLTSLSTAGRALLWAVQGYIAAPLHLRLESDRHDGRLAREFVIDHDEYRRVTHREPHFRPRPTRAHRITSLSFCAGEARRLMTLGIQTCFPQLAA